MAYPPRTAPGSSRAPAPAPMWSGRTTRQWLTSGILWSLAILAGLGALGVWASARADAATSQLTNHSSPALAQAAYLEAALLNQETGVRGYGLTGQSDFLQPYNDGVDQERTATDSLRVLLAGNSARLAELDDVLREARAWQGQFAQAIADATPADAKALIAQNAAEGKQLFDIVRAATEEQQHNLTEDARANHHALSKAEALRWWIFAAIVAVVALLAGLIFEALRQGVTMPLDRLSGDVREVAGGALDHPVIATGPADLRALASDVEAMRLRLVGELQAVDEARRQLDEQAAELQRSNAELEQFAYVASHDLQEPLRKVASFCQLLQRRYAGQLDERADVYIGYAVDGANRMQALIQDLLAFSRVGRIRDRHTEVALESVLESALEALSVSIEESGAEVTHDPLPSVDGDTGQLVMLFQNLVGNAVKFRAPERPARIHVSAERDGDRWRFAVEDNGIGIAPEFADRVFTIFQRLHSREAYPGNGIGLAVCRKIVDFHGGEISVDPRHEPGTRIVFTLPAHAEAMATTGTSGDPAATAGPASRGADIPSQATQTGGSAR